MYAAQQADEAEARGDYAKAQFWRQIAAKVDEAPPLTPELRDRLRVLLRPGPGPDGRSIAA